MSACPKCGHGPTIHGAFSCWVKGCECGMHVALSGAWCETTVPIGDHRCVEAPASAPPEPTPDVGRLPHYPPCPRGIILCLGSHESHARGECDLAAPAAPPTTGPRDGFSTDYTEAARSAAQSLARGTLGGWEIDLIRRRADAALLSARESALEGIRRHLYNEHRALAPTNTVGGLTPYGEGRLYEIRRAFDVLEKAERAPSSSPSRAAGESGPMTWGLSADEESFYGHYASKEEALANVNAEIGPLEPGQRFWVGGGRLWRPAFSVDADNLLDGLADHAGDECGEIAEDWPPSATREEAEALEGEIHEVVLAWLGRTGRLPTFYACEVIEERRASPSRADAAPDKGDRP